MDAARGLRCGMDRRWRRSICKAGRLCSNCRCCRRMRPTSPSSHPIAMALSPDEKTLYVALANRDAVAAVRVSGATMRTAAFYRHAAAWAGVFRIDAGCGCGFGRRSERCLRPIRARMLLRYSICTLRRRSMRAVIPIGFIPTEWYPTALAVEGNHLYVATGKGKGTGPNGVPQPKPANPPPHQTQRLDGRTPTLRRCCTDRWRRSTLDEAKSHLRELTQQVLESNLMYAAQKRIEFKGGGDKIHHVIYIIRENRTYDQLLGDLGVGDGDPSLTMYGEEITPNLHALALAVWGARQFLRFGRSFRRRARVVDGGESTAITTSAPGRSATGGMSGLTTSKASWRTAIRCSSTFPISTSQAAVICGPIWRAATSRSTTLASSFRRSSATTRWPRSRRNCRNRAEHRKASIIATHPFIHKGDAIPENYGGGTSQYPWPIPLIYKNVATKPELVGHFDPEYPDFELSFPDQLRVNEFLVHFNKWVADLKAGHDTMPAFVMLRLPNDHTAGTRPGSPTPKASVADNDLAVGRAVDAVSHSPYWDSTAFFVLEDDAQDGADHVDAHRSIALVVSKYAPHNPTPLCGSHVLHDGEHGAHDADAAGLLLR